MCNWALSGSRHMMRNVSFFEGDLCGFSVHSHLRLPTHFKTCDVAQRCSSSHYGHRISWGEDAARAHSRRPGDARTEEAAGAALHQQHPDVRLCGSVRLHHLQNPRGSLGKRTHPHTGRAANRFSPASAQTLLCFTGMKKRQGGYFFLFFNGDGFFQTGFYL